MPLHLQELLEEERAQIERIEETSEAEQIPPNLLIPKRFWGGSGGERDPSGDGVEVGGRKRSQESDEDEDEDDLEGDESELLPAA